MPSFKTMAVLAMSCSISTAYAFTPPSTPDPEPEPPANNGTITDGRYVFFNLNSGKALTVAGGSQNEGSNVEQRDYSQQSYQQWDVASLGNGYFSVRAANSGMALDVWEWNASDGADARIWNWLNGENQHWQIQSTGNGAYTVISRFSGKALEVFESSTSNGANVGLWTYWGGETQQWQVQAASGGGNNGGGNNGGGNNGGGNSGQKGASCSANGSVTVNETIRVTSGVYDGGCKVFNPTSALGDGGQGEGQKPVFRVENGATLKNVIIGNNGADGIHFYNGGTIENITWRNVGEDAMTVKSEGNVTVRNISGFDGSDKFIQVNAPTNLTVSGCVVDNMGKFLRQNGGKTFPMSVTVTNCDISNMKEGIFRSDSPNSTARFTDSRTRNAGDICIGSWRSCTSSGISSF